MKGQTHFGMPRGAKMSLALNKTKIGCSSFKFKHYLQECTTSGKNLLLLHANNQWEIMEDQLSMKSFYRVQR
jgi:hypothetical protein